jgi:hypothetical protein
MGRMKIKNKNFVEPFRETLAYRMMLLTGWILVFIFATYQFITAVRADSTVGLIIAGALSAGSIFGVIYNANRLMAAKIPASTEKRLHRR